MDDPVTDGESRPPSPQDLRDLPLEEIEPNLSQAREDLGKL